jgi:hypothetical protein
MSRRDRRGSRTTSRWTPSPVSVPEVLREAGEIVGRVWTDELLRERDRLEFVLKATYEDYEVAYRELAVAQRSEDPNAIGAAHATLERALEAAQRSTTACERIRRELRAEVGPLSYVAQDSAPEVHAVVEQQAMADVTGQLVQDEPAACRLALSVPERPQPRRLRPWQWLRRR